MSKPSALITGVTGQDGSYLAELLLSKGYKVHGIMRRASNFNTQRVDHLYSNPDFKLHYGDVQDGSSLRNIIKISDPIEVYHLGAQSHVRVSFDMPEYTADVTAVGTLRLLEALRQTKPESRFYFAGSSEMFGAAQAPQNEETPFYPRSPYGASKVFGYWITVNYRESYNMHASCGILFNHESPRRGETFVTRKITRAATRIKLGLQDKLELGNLDAKRDWGFAGDYVQAMWMMLQQDKPDDYVIATGKSYSIREWLDLCFGMLELDWTKYVEINPRLFRPAEVDHLEGNNNKAVQKLGWVPQTGIKELAQIMIEHDMKLAIKDKLLS